MGTQNRIMVQSPPKVSLVAGRFMNWQIVLM